MSTPVSTGHLVEHVLGFVHLLRAMGVAVGGGQALDAVRGLDETIAGAREDFRAVLRCTLVSKRDDLPLFESAFDVFWKSRSEFDPSMLAIPRVQAPPRQLRLPKPPKPPDDGANEPPKREEELGITLAFTASEKLRQKDFAAFTYEEVQQSKRLLRKMVWRIRPRRTRRMRPARNGRQIDMRRTLRQNTRYGGEPLILARRERRQKPRPIVVLCDISGSMDRYSRMLLQFVHALSDGLHNVETFVFGTRLTRITRLLRKRDIDDAVTLVSKQVVDWSGGTRIGDAVRRFNYVWGRRVLGRGPVVLLISDGWDRGEPEVLGREMGRLRRSCHRLIWLNPLLGSPEYRPLTRGMQAALPNIDDFLPVHNLVSLEQLGEQLSKLTEQRRR